MTIETLDSFITDVASLVSSIDDEHKITNLVAERLSALLAGGYRLPPEVTRPSNERHMTYPLYIAPDESWSLACVVWNIGQRTPVHSHETWGVVGIYSGVERELRYLEPTAAESVQP
jgi:predicted metal-dependent enzyme (double-stranded beta helix superfamily)